MKKFQVKPAVYFGDDALRYVSALDAQRVLIITDPFMAAGERLHPLREMLPKTAKLTVFSEIYPDPDTALITKGLQVYLDSEPELVIALGGGSTIDAAKSILYCSGRIKPQLRSLFVAVPTTSGTGSEVTNFSVVTVGERKIPIVDDSLLPDVAILETGFTKTVPPSVTADTGMDVLTHAVEAYVSVNATNYTDALAEKAIELVFKYLPKTVRNGLDETARAQMHDASCMAGMAFTNASLGINHSLAHSLGGALHLPHGRANAIVLPWVILYNCADREAKRRYNNLSWKLGLTDGWEEDGVTRLVQAIRTLQKLLEIPQSLKEAGISELDFILKLDLLVQAALSDNCTRTNPVKPDAAQLTALYLNCYNGTKHEKWRMKS